MVVTGEAMKLPRDMTLGEIHHILSLHQFSSQTEHDNAFWYISELTKIVDFIGERIAAVPSLPCKCGYCEEIRNRKPRRDHPKVVEKKSEPINFSLD